MEQLQHEDFYDAGHRNMANFGTKEYYENKWNILLKFSIDRFHFYDILLKLTAITQIRNLRLIIENPYHPTNFTNHFFFLRVTMIDKDRTRRGDYFKKPTGYWFVNCKPTNGFTEQHTDKELIRTITAGSGAMKTKREKRATVDKDELDKKYIDHKSAVGLCDEDRSMISTDYARNFICDNILGIE